MSMHRYWLFTSESYYPGGGMCDFKQSCVTVEEAICLARGMESDDSIDWWHVFDSNEGRIVAESECKPYGFEQYPEFR